MPLTQAHGVHAGLHKPRELSRNSSWDRGTFNIDLAELLFWYKKSDNERDAKIWNSEVKWLKLRKIIYKFFTFSEKEIRCYSFKFYFEVHWFIYLLPQCNLI